MFEMTLLQSASTPLVSVILFILIIGFYLLGHRLRSNAIKKNSGQSESDSKAINGMLLALLGLLLAFTFGMSNSRFNNRRDLVIEEANIIGTAILRTDIYPDSIKKLLRANLKEYLETRIEFYAAGKDLEKTVTYYRKGETVGKKVWLIAATYAKTDDITTRTSQLIPSLNAMIDIAATRRAAGEGTIPDSIMYFLFILCFCAAFLLGYEHRDKIDWIVVTGFAVMLSATVFNIIDLDRPRSGLINMDVPNQKIKELRDMFDGN